MKRFTQEPFYTEAYGEEVVITAMWTRIPNRAEYGVPLPPEPTVDVPASWQWDDAPEDAPEPRRGTYPHIIAVVVIWAALGAWMAVGL